jgi:F0F1-type ATP synthase membrane subunit a
MFQNLFAADFPVLGPLILYAQGLLVALIQAFVFPLLVAIFIKIAQESE